MLSFKRLLGVILFVAAVSSVFLLYNMNGSLLTGNQFQSCLAPAREFTETRQVNEGEKPIIRILGNPEDERCGKIYGNVLQFCEDIHLTVQEDKYLDTSLLAEHDLVVFCNDSISSYADLTELERFIAEGGRVILAAGLAEEDSDVRLWQALGIKEVSAKEDYHDLVFENPLLPVQPEQVYYNRNSESIQIEVSDDASVYIRDEESEVPLLYTYDWKKGSVCLINGTFLTDVRYMGLLSGAVAAMLPDFVYPVLGVKVVFLDNFPLSTSAGDALCRRAYGYSEEGFIQDVVWPTFQGISLRTNTPYTSGILAGEDSGTMDKALLKTIGKHVLQFGGELIYAADCQKEGEVIIDKEFTNQFSEIFPGYTIQGLMMEADNFSPEMPDVPDADIHSIRGMLGSSDARFFGEDGYTVFPAATEGSSMENGNLFAICSVLGAYGMISHVFDVNTMIVGDGLTAAWDVDKKQIALFESEILSHAAWLEGRTLTQTEGDVRSYLDMDYGWVRNDTGIELDCSGIAKGQAFFYHTDDRITSAKGLTYQYVGNGYYLLRVQENHGIITLEEGK